MVFSLMASDKEGIGRTPTSLADLAGGLGQLGGRSAMVMPGREVRQEWSYRELGEFVERLAAGLRALGVERGERVALLADGRPEWVAACFGVLRMGGVVVPVDAQLPPELVQYALEDSGAKAVFTTTQKAESLGAVLASQRVLHLDRGSDDPDSWCAAMAEPTGHPEPPPEAVAALFYTSGTTGPPKGVPLSHANLLTQIETIKQARIVRAGDRVLLPLPLHHVYPFSMGLLAPLALGLTLILPRSLTGPKLVRALRQEQATLLIGVPRLYQAVYEGLEGKVARWGRWAAALFRGAADLSGRVARYTTTPAVGRALFFPIHRALGRRLRVLACGGAPLDPILARRLEGLGWRLFVGYGLTETAPLITLASTGAPRDSVGRPVPGVEVRIAPPGEGRRFGELWVRGPNVFSGYHHLPEKTAEVLDQEGWFHTGDLGELDADGYLRLRGRASTLLVTEGGENIQPEPLEEAYEEHPAIKEIAVLQEGGRLVALVVPASPLREESRPQIQAALAERGRTLPSYQRLTDFALTAVPLPRTRLGKLRRHLLADLYRKAREGGEEGPPPGLLPEAQMSGEDRELLQQAAVRKVWQWLGEHYPDQPITPDTRPDLDLGVDSMEWLNITMAIGERAGVELSDESIARVETVRDLLREVAEGAEEGVGYRGDPLARPEELLSRVQRRWLEPLNPFMEGVFALLYGLLRLVMRLLFRIRIKGMEHLPPSGNYLLTPAHNSYLDPFAIGLVLGYRRLRHTYWGGWVGAAFHNPLVRFGSRASRVVPVDPEQGATASLALGAVVMKRGFNLVWFPEGRRSPDGTLQPFRPGVGLLLARRPLPVLPVRVAGARRLWPPERALPRPGRLTVTIGPPVQPAELQRLSEGGQGYERIVEELMRRVAALGQGD